HYSQRKLVVAESKQIAVQGPLPAALLLVRRAMAGEGSQRRQDVATAEAALSQDPDRGVEDCSRANRRLCHGPGVFLPNATETIDSRARCIEWGCCSAPEARKNVAQRVSAGAHSSRELEPRRGERSVVIRLTPLRG